MISFAGTVIQRYNKVLVLQK